MKLWAAITAQRVKGITCEAFGVDSNQRRSAREVADVQDGVFLPVGRITKGSYAKIPKFSREKSVRLGCCLIWTWTSGFHVTKSTEFVYKHSSFSYKGPNCV